MARKARLACLEGNLPPSLPLLGFPLVQLRRTRTLDTGLARGGVSQLRSVTTAVESVWRIFLNFSGLALASSYTNKKV